MSTRFLELFFAASRCTTLAVLLFALVATSSCDRNCTSCDASPTVPVNQTPVATELTVTVAEDSSVNITLAGTDADGTIMDHAVATSPDNGTLTGTAPNLQYTPDADFNGADSFTFTVTDDAGAVSAPTRVSIEVTPVNDAPVAMSQSVAVDEDGAVAIVLAGSDVDGDIVAYQITGAPPHGTLGGDAPSLIYMPEVDYNGPDSFTFTVTDDAGAVSAPARVSIEVTPVNDAPVAMSQSVAVDEDGAVAIVLAGSDVDGDTVAYQITGAPRHGTLGGDAPSLTYMPEVDYNGPDSFTFTVTDDAGAVSAPARVSIEVTPVNDAPVAMSQSVAVDEDGAVAIVLAGSDVDGDIVAYQVTAPPRHGTLGGDAPSLTYMPEVDYNGPDSFTFTVTDDAGAVSAPARVSIEVTPVNDAPVAMSQSVAVDEDDAVAIVLAGSDVDGDIVAYQIADDPGHGTVTGDAPSLTYMPEVDYNGPDSFTFTVTDGDGTVSTPADVSITVTPVNDAPVAMSQSVAVDEDGAVAIVLAGSDVDGDIVAYQVTDPPRHGTLGGDAPSLIYMPEVDYNGPDSFTFTVTDDAGAVSAPARVSIEVTPVNDAPVAMSQSVAVDEDGAVAIVLAGSDVDGDTGCLPNHRQPSTRHARRRCAKPDLHAGGRLQRPRLVHVHSDGRRRYRIDASRRVDHRDAGQRRTDSPRADRRRCLGRGHRHRPRGYGRRRYGRRLRDHGRTPTRCTVRDSAHAEVHTGSAFHRHGRFHVHGDRRRGRDVRRRGSEHRGDTTGLRRRPGRSSGFLPGYQR